MPTPETRSFRWLILGTCFAILITAASINIAGYFIGGDKLKENRHVACNTKDKLHTYLETDSVLRNQQATNSRNNIKAQKKFIDDTEALLKLLRKAPNQKALAPIELYFQDQIDTQKIQRKNSLKNIQLSEKAADKFHKLGTGLLC